MNVTTTRTTKQRPFGLRTRTPSVRRTPSYTHHRSLTALPRRLRLDHDYYFCYGLFEGSTK